MRVGFYRREPKQEAVPPEGRGKDKGGQRALAYARKLARMVQYDTTSYPYSAQHPRAAQLERYRGYHRLLEDLFPLVHRHLEKTEIDGSLLYRWKGKSDSRPIVLMGHQDVVPVEGASWGSPGPSPALWDHLPFSGDIADGKVWGRGSVDTKCSCMAIFQAMEELLELSQEKLHQEKSADLSGGSEEPVREEGQELPFVPPQDVYFSTSCTEEWGGPGCPALVEELAKRGVKPWLVCDEGGGIYTHPMPGVSGSFAMIGVGEKGRANVCFIARGKGGHASTPRKNTPIARLAAFVSHIEKHSPFQSAMEPETRAMLEAVAPAAVLPVRLALRNLWLFQKPIELVTPGLNGQAAAMLGTTMTFTMISGGDAVNVFPQEARVTANLRFAHHQDMGQSLKVIGKIAGKYGLEMEVLHASPCTKKVDIHGEAYRHVEDIIRQTFPGMKTSPYILTAATDASFFDSICDNCIRFAPIVYGPQEKSGIHGTNEALRYDCLSGAVDFYKNLIRSQA